MQMSGVAQFQREGRGGAALKAGIVWGHDAAAAAPWRAGGRFKLWPAAIYCAAFYELQGCEVCSAILRGSEAEARDT